MLTAMSGVAPIMSKWIEITQEEKEVMKKAMDNSKATSPTFFNLRSDRNDYGGSFAEMTREQVIEAAEKAAKNLIAHRNDF